MKAALLTGTRQFAIHDIPKPEVSKDTDVLIRIRMVGVCGSDMHYYTTGRIGSQVVEFPFIIGHESAGIVERVGSRVTRVKPGQNVAIDPSVTCGICDQCRAGRENTCRELVFMGNPQQRQGALCEYIIHDEKGCFPLDDHTPFEQAVLSEPLAIALYAVEQSRHAPDANVAIIGVGPVGLSVFHVLRTRDIGHIYVTDKQKSRLEYARKLNPDWSGNPDETDIVNEISKCASLSLDIVYECSGDPDVIDQAVELLKPGGVLVILGIPETDYVSFPIHQLRRKEITILNIRRQAHCTQKAIDLLERRQVQMDEMVTHHFPLEKIQEAFELVAGYKDDVIKAVISID